MTLKEQIHNWMAGREDEFVDALAPLIAIDSTTGEAAPGMPFGPGPDAAMKAGLKLAREWGMHTWEDEGYVGLVDLNEKEDLLHILAHMDIVGVGEGWDTPPLTLVRDGDIIYGRGTDDDKGPAVASLLAMRCIKELGIPLKGNVKLILGTDEETGSRDLAHYFANHPFAPCSMTPDSDFPVTNIEKAGYAPKFSHSWETPADAACRLVKLEGGIRVNVAPGNCTALVKGLTTEQVEGAMGEIAAATGVAFSAEEENGLLKIDAVGVPAHASRPDQGKNAITAMLALLVKLPLAQDAPMEAVVNLNKLFPYGDNGGKAIGIAQKDEISGELTLSLSVLNLDDQGFTARFDSRDPLCATEENTKGVVEKVFAGLGWDCQGHFNPAHYVDENSPFIKTLLETYEEFSGRKGYCEAIGGGTYVHHIPGGVAFGAGEHDFDSRLHSANERARISQLLLTAEIYAAVIARVCGE